MLPIDLSKLIIKKVCAVNEMHITSRNVYSRRNRETWALSIKLDGLTIYKAGEKRCISDNTHVVLLPKGISYSGEFIELGKCYLIEFEADYDGVVFGPESYHVKSVLYYANKVKRMESLWTFKKPAYELQCMSGVYDILAALYENEMTPYYYSSKYKLIEPSIKYLEANYSDSTIDNETLAATAKISTVYFRKLFSLIYGMPPGKYLQTVRVEKAKDMLASDYMSVSAVSEAVGFDSIFYFSKVFKKATGFTPTEYARFKSSESKTKIGNEK